MSFLDELEIAEDVKESPVEKEKTKPLYQSKDGFEKVDVLRGITEISNLYDIVTPLGGLICGGYVRYCVSPREIPETAGDVDVYCTTEPNFEAIKNALEKEGLKSKNENDVSVTYNRIFEGILKYSPIIQLIKPIKVARIVAFGSIEQILSNFDFTVVRVGLLSKTEALVDADFLHDESKKILRLKNIHCPISSTLRCMKYSRKGYWLKPMEVFKLFWDWDARSPEYKSELAFLVNDANEGEGLTQEQVDQLEEMMRID